MSNPNDLRELEKDPRLFLYTSLTAGSSHIITATSRLETILKANKIPFQAIDVATDEKARKLWQRRGGGKKLPGLVKDGYVLGDLEEIEEWNEYGELKENIGPVPAAGATVPAPKLPIIPTATAGTSNVSSKPAIDTSKMVALPGAAEIKARNNPLPVSSPEDAVKPEKMTSAPADKEKSIQTSIRFKGDLEQQADHLSAPASAIASASASPQPTAVVSTVKEAQGLRLDDSKERLEDDKHVEISGDSAEKPAASAKVEESPEPDTQSSADIKKPEGSSSTVSEEPKQATTSATDTTQAAEAEGATNAVETQKTTALPPSDNAKDQAAVAETKQVETLSKDVTPDDTAVSSPPHNSTATKQGEVATSEIQDQEAKFTETRTQDQPAGEATAATESVAD